MAEFGQVSLPSGGSDCCWGGKAPCNRPQEEDPEDRIANAFRDINAVFVAATQYAETRMREAGLTDQTFTVRATERDVLGKAIGATTVKLGLGKLAIAASVATGVVTVTILTAGGSGSSESTEGARLSPSDYRTELKATCAAADTKLAERREINQDALPLVDLVAVLAEQLKEVDALRAPEELAATHTALTAAARDRIALLEKALADDATKDQVTALLGQADVAAEQMSKAYDALGVPECNQ
jgi:hypothetical protein